MRNKLWRAHGWAGPEIPPRQGNPYIFCKSLRWPRHCLDNFGHHDVDIMQVGHLLHLSNRTYRRKIKRRRWLFRTIQRISWVYHHCFGPLLVWPSLGHSAHFPNLVIIIVLLVLRYSFRAHGKTPHFWYLSHGSAFRGFIWWNHCILFYKNYRSAKMLCECESYALRWPFLPNIS